MMTKKGFIASYMVDFYAYLVFAAIIIIFFIVMAFAASPVEKELSAKKISADLTTVLIKTLQTRINIDGKIITPAEIISSEDLTKEKEFQKTIQESIETSYPSKNDLNYGWIRVYTAEEAKKENPCVNGLFETDSGKYFRTTSGFSYGRGYGNLNVDPKSIAYARVQVPIKNRIDYAVAVFCISKNYFK